MFLGKKGKPPDSQPNIIMEEYGADDGVSLLSTTATA
jgi:hypothetical protein